MYYKKADREFKDKFNSYVNFLPLPKDFENWLDKYPFKNTYYMFFRIEGKGKNKQYIGACQHCKNKDINLKTVKSGSYGICPICRKKVKYRNEKFSKLLRDKDYVLIAQPVNIQNMYVLRKFLVIKESNYIDYRYIKYEMERCCIEYNISSGFKVKFWFKEYNLDWAFGFYKNMSYTLPDIVWTYYKNLNCLFYDDFKYCSIKDYAKTRTVCLFEYLKTYKDFPQIEYLVKLKMFNLVNDIINYGSYKLHFDNQVKNILGLNSVYYKFALKLNKSLNLEMIDGLRFLQSYKIQPNIENLNVAIKLDNMLCFKDNKYIFLKLGFNLITSYLKQSHCNLRDYFDYILNCKKLKYNLQDTAITKPKDFKKAHDEAYKRVKYITNKEIYEKANNILNNLQILEFKNKELALIVPQEVFDLVEEGKNLSHCVGSYIERVANKESMIFFIRKIEELDKSYFTLEINPKNFKIVQCRGLHNVSADEKILKFVHKWQKEKLNSLKVI